MHAQSILDEVIIAKNFDEAIHGMDYLVATSAISSKNEKRHLRRTMPLREFAEKIYQLDGRIGIVFGREDIGLLNEEIEKCDLLVKIPTSEKYPSLNLSHAVCLVLYELYANKCIEKEPRPAGKIEKENLYRCIGELLDSIDYPSHKRKNTEIMIERIIGRAMLGKWEYHTLMGVIKGAIKNKSR
jgi:TrmH family RNA methyltransferase